MHQHVYQYFVLWLMRTSVSAFRLFPTDDPSNSKGWWCFVCVDMFEVPLVSLTTELHCSHTATTASVQPSVFHLSRLKHIHRSLISLWYLGLGGTWFHMCPPCRWDVLPFRELQRFPMCFLQITADTNMDNRPVPAKPEYWCKPPPVELKLVRKEMGPRSLAPSPRFGWCSGCSFNRGSTANP